MSKKIVEYWETKRLPRMHRTSADFRMMLDNAYNPGNMDSVLGAPYLSRDEIQERQFARLRELVGIALNNCPFYREKYRAAGFELGDLGGWGDYHNLPVVTKSDMIEGFNGAPSGEGDQETFYTRSSGSSGRTLKISVDNNAIIVDTLQGIRQFWIQSGQGYSKDHTIAHVYTVPWWVDSLKEGDYQSIFISSLIPPQEIGEILKDVNPDILSLYPSNLASLMEVIPEEVRRRLILTAVHSEISTRDERSGFGSELGCPVLDEYSSEELTRIALELPCGHYHVCEDTVILDVLDPITLQPIDSGIGLAVGTNLLNESMPFIRYLQDDFISMGSQDSCEVNWKQIEDVEGRQNDSFIRRDGSYVPPGTLLDLTYRWMFDSGINIRDFELIQRSPNHMVANINEPSLIDGKVVKSREHLQGLISSLMGEVDLEFNLVDQIDKSGRKYRPIRRSFVYGNEDGL
jgi:phenylacetate-CoA ligase